MPALCVTPWGGGGGRYVFSWNTAKQTLNFDPNIPFQLCTFFCIWKLSIDRSTHKTAAHSELPQRTSLLWQKTVNQSCGTCFLWGCRFWRLIQMPSAAEVCWLFDIPFCLQQMVVIDVTWIVDNVVVIIGAPSWSWARLTSFFFVIHGKAMANAHVQYFYGFPLPSIYHRIVIHVGMAAYHPWGLIQCIRLPQTCPDKRYRFEYNA